MNPARIDKVLAETARQQAATVWPGATLILSQDNDTLRAVWPLPPKPRETCSHP